VEPCPPGAATGPLAAAPHWKQQHAAGSRQHFTIKKIEVKGGSGAV
jgi:hypothetical protein